MDKKKIIKLLATIIKIDEDQLIKTPVDTKLSELGLDSIQFIQFIVALEEKFNIEVLDSDLMVSNFQTIDTLYQTLEKYFVKEVLVKKVLVCDCDNVLWHGVAGEEQVYTDALTDAFQERVVELYDRGVLICLCSKNQPENIEVAFSTLNMPLKKEHILLSKVNITNKATNIKEIASELDLSIDSLVFVDDSRYEIDLVSSIIPEITAIHADYSDCAFINSIGLLFDSNSTDIDRTQQYREQKEREKERQQYATAEEFNASLKTEVTCGLAVSAQAPRIAELSQRTNQFNLSDSRYSESQINSFINDKNYSVYTLSISDTYGDMGLIGTAIVCNLSEPMILDFYLSCRAFGRNFEKILINKIIHDHPSSLTGVYNRTEKNCRFENFYPENGVEIHE